MQQYDMVVIGSGPSGRRAAIQSAKLGKSVLVVDKGSRLGGVSVHTADGKYLGVFECDEHAANLTFGGPDFSTLFMTTGTSVHSIETAVRGLVPGSR